MRIAVKRRRIALLLSLCLPAAPAWAAPEAAAARALPADVQHLRQWVERRADHGGRPFIVIDKSGARLWLFGARGELLGDTPVLLGLARGDHSVPGIGERAMADIRPHERTTPAGRFFAEAGRNLGGEEIFWIDYDAALSMHRVRAANRAERRLQRLASPTAADNRISYGCVNVPAAFFDALILPSFGSGGVVYVLPETMSPARVFGGIFEKSAGALGSR